MALVNKRITELPERSALNLDDFTVVDGDTGGTAKYNLGNMDDDISDLKTAISEMPTNVGSDDADVDFDIADEDGNVIVRFEDGHIKSKNFDSSNINTESPVDNKSVSGSADLGIVDSSGNVIVQFSDGHIKTRKFDSSNNYIRQRTTYSQTVEYTGATTVTFDQNFYTGDELMFHASIVGKEVTDDTAYYKITYKAVDKYGSETTLCQDYGFNFPSVKLTFDVVAIKVYLPGSLIWGADGNIKVFVYQIYGDPVINHTVTVKKDGTGDYSTIRAALDAITDCNLINRYTVEIYPGQYDVMEDYTQEEIEDEDFKGLMVKNGITIKGVGQIDDIIVSAVLSTTDYESSDRNKVSTFNMAGWSNLENLTILAENIRYCIHDDIGSNGERRHVFKDLILRAKSMTSASAYCITFGAGYGNSKCAHFINVDFGDVCSIHGSENWTKSPQIIFDNCTAKLFQFGEQASVEKMYVTLNNCKALAVRINRTNSGDQLIRVNGVGTDNAIIDCYAGCVYNLGQCRKYEDIYNYSVGQAVKLGTAYALQATTNKENMIGIVLGKLDGDTYVQTGGFLDSNTFGISGLSVGDYVTLDANGVLTDGGTASNAVGVVVGTNSFEGGAFIKML